MFSTIAIVGFGLVGGSLGLAIKRRWPGAVVTAIDRPDVVETAMEMHAADAGGNDLGLAADADLIVLAAPVLENIRILRGLPEIVSGSALITDTSSTKREIAAVAGALPARLRFIGGHPLAGAAVSGIEAARHDLFEGGPWLLTPGERTSEQDAERLESFVRALGAVPQRMDAAAHDRLLAFLSHLPQLAASALMDVVGTHAGVEGLALGGRGLRDTTRLATSPASVWRDIVRTNRAEVVAALDALIAVLQELRGDAASDGRVLTRVFDSAGQWKKALEGDRQPERSGHR